MNDRSRSEGATTSGLAAFPVPPPRAAAWLVAASLAACSVEAQVGERTRGTTPDGVVRLDVLFVIDDSGSMSEEQLSLAENFPAFVAALNALPGGLPDLHVGVVSTNLGVSGSTTDACGFSAAGCVDDGDGATLRNEPRRDGCVPLADRFLASRVAGDGARIDNFSGSLSDAFACIAELGTAGCGLEQPLEAMRRALDGTVVENAGFLRDDAFLAIVVIADEDDCSARDCAMFDPAEDEADDPLGHFGSFRCTEFGVVCDGGTIARTPAEYDDCQPRAEGYLEHPRRYVDFLGGLKTDPTKIVVSVVAGDRTPFVVEQHADGRAALAASCASDLGEAAPGVRLAWFAQQFGERGSFHTICDDDLSPAIASIGGAVRSRIESWEPPPSDPAYATGCAVGGGRSGAPWRALAAAALLLWLATKNSRTLSSPARRRSRSSTPGGLDTRCRRRAAADEGSPASPRR